MLANRYRVQLLSQGWETPSVIVKPFGMTTSQSFLEEVWNWGSTAIPAAGHHRNQTDSALTDLLRLHLSGFIALLVILRL